MSRAVTVCVRCHSVDCLRGTRPCHLTNRGPRTESMTVAALEKEGTHWPGDYTESRPQPTAPYHCTHGTPTGEPCRWADRCTQ